MARLKVVNEVRVYEHNDAEPDSGMKDFPPLVVKNHWNSSDMVDLSFLGQKITVVASDLKRAVENATNVGL